MREKAIELTVDKMIRSVVVSGGGVGRALARRFEACSYSCCRNIRRTTKIVAVVTVAEKGAARTTTTTTNAVAVRSFSQNSYYATRSFSSSTGGGTSGGNKEGLIDDDSTEQHQELRPSDQDLLAKEKAKTGKTTFSRRRMVQSGSQRRDRPGEIYRLMGKPLQTSAGPLWGSDIFSDNEDDDEDCEEDQRLGRRSAGNSYIPEVKMYEGDGREKKRVLILCTGGTLTMAPDPTQGGALAPVEGAISSYMQSMNELFENGMPEFVLHEYTPFVDSSDLGPADWKTLADDIKVCGSVLGEAI